MKHLKALVFSLIACTFVPALIVVAFSYWQKLVDEVAKLVEDLPLLNLLWNILQIALALGLLLILAWIIRKVFSYLKSGKKPKIDTDSSNIIISVVIALVSSSVILGIAGLFTNPVTNIVKILLSFIDDPLVSDSYSGIYSDGLTPMKSSVMMFTNIALFCWTAYWSYIFILGIVEEIRGKNPEADKAKALLKKHQAAQQAHFQAQTGQTNPYQQPNQGPAYQHSQPQQPQAIRQTVPHQGQTPLAPNQYQSGAGQTIPNQPQVQPAPKQTAPHHGQGDVQPPNHPQGQQLSGQAVSNQSQGQQASGPVAPMQTQAHQETFGPVAPSQAQTQNAPIQASNQGQTRTTPAVEKASPVPPSQADQANPKDSSTLSTPYQE